MTDKDDTWTILAATLVGASSRLAARATASVLTHLGIISQEDCRKLKHAIEVESNAGYEDLATYANHLTSRTDCPCDSCWRVRAEYPPRGI